jgi:hypothetical protein
MQTQVAAMHKWVTFYVLMYVGNSDVSYSINVHIDHTLSIYVSYNADDQT